MMSLDKNWKALPEDEMRKLLRTLNKPSFKKIVDEATVRSYGVMVYG